MQLTAEAHAEVVLTLHAHLAADAIAGSEDCRSIAEGSAVIVGSGR